jgi:translation initiation factor IF-2
VASGALLRATGAPGPAGGGLGGQNQPAPVAAVTGAVTAPVAPARLVGAGRDVRRAGPRPRARPSWPMAATLAPWPSPETAAGHAPGHAPQQRPRPSSSTRSRASPLGPRQRRGHRAPVVGPGPASPAASPAAAGRRPGSAAVARAAGPAALALTWPPVAPLAPGRARAGRRAGGGGLPRCRPSWCPGLAGGRPRPVAPVVAVALGGGYASLGHGGRPGGGRRGRQLGGRGPGPPNDGATGKATSVAPRFGQRRQWAGPTPALSAARPPPAGARSCRCHWPRPRRSAALASGRPWSAGRVLLGREPGPGGPRSRRMGGPGLD